MTHPKAKIDTQMKQVLIVASDEIDPERHHLHVAACTHGGHRVSAKGAFDLDQTEHELGVEPGALGLVMHGDEELFACNAIRYAFREADGHLAKPGPRFHFVFEREIRHRRSETALLSAARTLADSGSYIWAPAYAPGAANASTSMTKPAVTALSFIELPSSLV